MGHSEKYDKVLGYYRTGMWSIERVKNAVVKNWITESEYREITGEVYSV